MPRVPERLTFPLLILTSGVLAAVALREALDRKEGKQRARIPLHNPRAFTFEGFTGTKGSSTAAARGSSSSSSASPSSTK